MPPIAPAFPNENAFYCRFFVDVGSYVDEDQRRLHEVDFRPESDPQSYGPCPFRDSRRGFLINKAALHQIATQWNSVLAGLRYCSGLIGGKIAGKPPLDRAWRITMSTMFAPLYLLKRRDNPIANGHLPVPVAGLFKIMLDVPTTIDLMLMSSIQESVEQHEFKAIREYADRNLILLNGEYACAGSPGLIDESLKILFDDVEPDWQSNAQFRSYFPDPFELVLFAYCMSCQYVGALLYQLSTALAMEFAFADLARSGAYRTAGVVDETRLPAYERRRRIALSILMRSDDPGEIFGRLAQLVEDRRIWHVPSGAEIDLSGLLEHTRCFAQVASQSRPRDILVAHQVYEARFYRWLRFCQQKIERAIGAREIFPSQPILGPSRQHPATLLSEVIEAGVVTNEMK